MELDWNAEATDAEPRVEICGRDFARRLHVDGTVSYCAADPLDPQTCSLYGSAIKGPATFHALIGSSTVGHVASATAHGFGDTPEQAIEEAIGMLREIASANAVDRWVRWWSGADAG
jgi:hypothetical protein